LLHRLAGHYGVTLTGVPVIGDSRRDLEAARAAGARPVLVRTGNGARTEAAGEAGDAEVYDDLSAAADALAEEA
jgi:D-glycero-D-manno-heptose 1,7-bisphosphate phosphatase